MPSTKVPLPLSAVIGNGLTNSVIYFFGVEVIHSAQLQGAAQVDLGGAAFVLMQIKCFRPIA